MYTGELRTHFLFCPTYRNPINTAKDDEDPTTLTKEVLEVRGESSWCIFWGNQSRKRYYNTS